MNEYNEDEFVKHDIVFVEETHTYLVDGQEVPSVTTILQPLATRAYGKVNPSVLQYAANRGTAVHEALEMYDLGGELEYTPEIEGYIKAYLEWAKVYKPKWVSVEEIVYDDKSNYIGTLDRAGYLNGMEFAVVDLKTSQPTKEALVSVCTQTHAYAEAYFWTHPEDAPTDIKRYGLFLKSDGTYRFLDCKNYEEGHNFNAKDLWCDLFLLYRKLNYILNH